MNLYLASSSERRKDLLDSINIKYIIEVSDIDETIDLNLSPIENVKALGLKKALAVAKLHPNDVVLGCDTIVLYDGVIYGKPKDEKDAYRMLKTFSGKTHEVISGVGIIRNKKTYNFTVTSKVTFKDLTDEQINNYINTKECFGKAGSYAIQGIGKNLILKYEGELENIIGLPLKEVREILGELL